MNCSICFCQSDEVIACERCVSYICHDCANAMLSFLTTQTVLPKCVQPQCDGEYLLSQFPPSLQSIYTELCQKVLSLKKKQTRDKNFLHKQMLQQVRKQRLAFIQSSYPPALVRVIEFGLQHKLKHVSQKNAKTMSKHVKRCQQPNCKGIQDPWGECNLCRTTVCTKCDILILSKQHVCTQADLDTKATVDKLVHCPECDIPAVRSYGCNNITCAVCKTNYNYTTGERTIHGNHHDVSVTVVTRDLATFVNLYPEFSNLTSQEPIVTPLQNTSAKAYETWVRNRWKKRDFDKMVEGLWQQHHDTPTEAKDTKNKK